MYTKCLPGLLNVKSCLEYVSVSKSLEIMPSLR